MVSCSVFFRSTGFFFTRCRVPIYSRSVVLPDWKIESLHGCVEFLGRWHVSGRLPAQVAFSCDPRGDQASKRSEGMPAFGLPVLSLIFLVESFLFHIYWLIPSIFGREVRMKCLCRFFLRLRGAHDPRSLHALRLVSPHFRKCDRFSQK